MLRDITRVQDEKAVPAQDGGVYMGQARLACAELRHG